MSHTAVDGEKRYSVLIVSIAYIERKRSLLSCSKGDISFAVNSTYLFALDICCGLKEVTKPCTFLYIATTRFSRLLGYIHAWLIISLRGVVGSDSDSNDTLLVGFASH